MSDPLLRVENLTKRFEPHGPDVVDHLDFSVEEGEIFALLGPSGCGKTTTLRLIAGFERADAGSVRLDGRTVESTDTHVPPDERGVGLVFQNQALFPHLSVEANVGFGLDGWSEERRNQRVREVLEMVGLKGLGHRNPHELSGGQQQRVAVARALAPRPRVILLDEPFSNLDAVLRQAVREDVRDLLKEAGTTAVMVTHDQEEALSFADRLGVMRSGSIEQTGTPEAIYYGPRTLFVAQFLGRTNLLLSQCEGQEAKTALGRLPINREATGSTLVSLRPEHLTLEAPAGEDAEAGTEGHDEPNGRQKAPPNARRAARRDAEEGDSTAVVVDREFRGHDITYRVRYEDTEYLVHTDNRTLFEPGDPVRLRVLEPAVVLESQPREQFDAS